MPPTETARRAERVEAVATIVLEDGLDALALRGLAARLSTSGRMLPYRFTTRDALVRAMLACIAGRMAVLREGGSRRAGNRRRDRPGPARLDRRPAAPVAGQRGGAVAVPAIMEGITILEMARPGTTRPARRLLPALPDRSAD